MNEAMADRQIAMGNHVQARSHWDIAKALYDLLATEPAAAGATRVSKKLSKLDQLPDQDKDADGAAA